MQGVAEDDLDETMSLARSLGVSYGHVRARNPQAARLFAVMGLLPGGALADDLSAIWGTDWEPSIDELVGKSLVERERSAFGERFYTFPLVTAFAEHQLSAEARREFALRVADRMAVISSAIHNGLGSTDAFRARAFFQLHEDNLRACLSIARPARDKRADEPASPVGVIAMLSAADSVARLPSGRRDQGDHRRPGSLSAPSATVSAKPTCSKP